VTATFRLDLIFDVQAGYTRAVILRYCSRNHVWAPITCVRVDDQVDRRIEVRNHFSMLTHVIERCDLEIWLPELGCNGASASLTQVSLVMISLKQSVIIAYHVYAVEANFMSIAGTEALVHTGCHNDAIRP
jgi:hypothetical protein